MATKVGMMTYFDAATGKPERHLGKVREDKLTRPELGHLGKAGAPPLRRLQEFRLQSVDTFAPGQPLDFAELFKKGDLVDVSGNSIGKGFQGIDGVGLGLIRHHERLAKMFEMWCLHIPVEDRTSFDGLVEYVERTVKSESSRAPDRPVYLVGESVGACIALAVAARNPDINLVLILVNPGTSFQKSQLQSLSAFLDLVPEPFHLSTPQFLNFLTVGNGKKMPGRMGGTKNKIRKLKIVKIDDDLRVLMIKGAVPGKPGNLLRIAPAKIVGNNIPKN